MGTAGTGGFGFVANSMEYFSPYTQYVIATFLILFGINFSLYYLILIGKIKDVFKSEELKSYFVIIFVSIIIIMISVIRDKMLKVEGYVLSFQSIEETFRHSYFQVASIITTTGFSTTNYEYWPTIAKTMIIFLMICGAMAGSTGGGIKVSRIVIAIKGIGIKIRKLINPRYVAKTKFEGKNLDDGTINDVFAFLVLYFTITFIVVLILGLDPNNDMLVNVGGENVQHDFLTNFTATISCLSNIGPGLSAVGPYSSFSFYSSFSKLILTFTMLIGRLEILPVLILFNKKTWEK